MASSFEKVMNACLESKKSADRPKSRVTEKKNTKKTVAPRTLKNEGKVKKSLRESDEEFAEDELENEVSDDIVIAVDPELDDTDKDTITGELQDIIDNTPEGEEPSTDEYIGDYTYSCPICGQTFISSVEMNEGDECPVCGETPDAFVIVGQIDEAEEGGEGEEYSDEEAPEEVPEESDEELEPNSEEEEGLISSAIGSFAGSSLANGLSKKECGDQSMYIDESTFNPFMTKFVRENYKNAKSFKMKSASLFGNRLTIECVVTMKSGKTKNTTLCVENFDPSRSVMIANESTNHFKIESTSKHPFVFSVRKVGKVIKCEGMKYKYTSKLAESNRRYEVSGRLIRESKKSSKK